MLIFNSYKILVLVFRRFIVKVRSVGRTGSSNLPEKTNPDLVQFPLLSVKGEPDIFPNLLLLAAIPRRAAWKFFFTS